MKSKTCPYKNNCHDSGSCESCDFEKVYASLRKRIVRLKAKNRRLEAENRELRERLKTLSHPDF